MAYVGTGGAMLPLLIFAAARAGLAFTPINYRLSADGIQALIQRLPDPLVIVDDRYRDMVGDVGRHGDGVRRLPGGRAHRRAGRGVPRPGLRRDRAVHVGHHVAAQGRRALAQQPDQLRHRDGRIRVGRTDRRRADLRAAVSHRRGQRRAVEPVRRPQDGLPAQLRRAGMGAADRRRAGDDRDGGADHAGPHRHRARGRRPSSCRRCATWPTAARRWACRWSAGRSNCCRMWASSTPTA